MKLLAMGSAVITAEGSYCTKLWRLDMRKSDGLEFEEWLGLVARSNEWNGRMRTPDGWRILYKLNYSVGDAAVCTKSSLQLSRGK